MLKQILEKIEKDLGNTVIIDIQEKVQDALSDLTDDYEFYLSGVERMDNWKTNFNNCDDGVVGASIQLPDMGNDALSYFPKKMRKFVEKRYESEEKDATKEWAGNNKDELKELGISASKVSYGELQDAGADDLAEDLDEYVREYMNGNGETYKALVDISYFDEYGEGDGKNYVEVEFSLILDSGYAQELFASFSSDEIFSANETINMSPNDKGFSKELDKVMKKLSSKVFG